MVFYCSTNDVASRMNLNSSQKIQAATKLTSAVRRSSIDIDQEFLDYGRTTPSREIGETTLNGIVAAGATSVVLTSGTNFASAGNGNIDGDSFAWTGKNTHTLTGVTGVSADHASGVTVQQGEFAHILREICADLSAAYYIEDESLINFRIDVSDGPNSGKDTMRNRGILNLRRLAHLGSMD